MARPIDPNHAGPRAFLRLVGPILLAAGALLMVLGAIQMFSPGSSRSSSPHVPMHSPGWFEANRRSMEDDFQATERSRFTGFGMVAAGMVCCSLGLVLTKLGYMGRVARYVAEEIGPVTTDTLNYIGAGAGRALRGVSQAIGSGLAAGARDRASSDAVACPGCGASNEVGSRFCDQCGVAMASSCGACGKGVQPDDRFCRHCGMPQKTTG